MSDAERSSLDDQYDTSKQLPDGDVSPYFVKFNAASERTRRELVHRRNVVYGPHERETLDLFPALRGGAPLLVWVHGGYWRRMSKDAFSYVAGPVVRAGGAAAILNYPLAPGPSLDDIVASVRRGFAWAVEHRRELGAAPGPVVVAGHSVGAQLAAMIAAAYPVDGLFTLSGLYDLEPLRATHINDWIAMDAATAHRNAPLHNPPRVPVPLVASAGGREQAAFHEQQAAYVRTWRAWGGAAREAPAAEHDHFTIALALDDDESALTHELLGLMGLRSRREDGASS